MRDGGTDGVKPVYPPTTSLCGGYNYFSMQNSTLNPHEIVTGLPLTICIWFVSPGPARDTEKLTNFWPRYFGTNQIIDNLQHFDEWLKNFYGLSIFISLTHKIIYILCRLFLITWKMKLWMKLKENLGQHMIQLSYIFWYSFVLILKWNHLPVADRIRCRESGTPLTNIYTWWSSRHYGLGCHAPMVIFHCKKSVSKRYTATVPR